MAKTQVDDATEALKYQTWVFKVSIHCEGCKKKVKKILQNIDGVYTTVIDSQQQKVSVTGNVAADTLIKKLGQKGKLAELWPQNPENSDKYSGKSKKKKKQNDPKSSENSTADDKNLADKTEDSNKDSGNKKETQNGQGEKQPENIAGADKFPAEEKNGREREEVAAETGGGGNGGKKKKKKGQKSNNNYVGDGGNGGHAVTSTGSPPMMNSVDPGPRTGSINLNPLFDDPYPYPPTLFPPPVYGLSYNASYPSSTPSSYYVPPEFVYSHPRPYTYPPPPPSDPITAFDNDRDYDNDYNGGCLIM